MVRMVLSGLMIVLLIGCQASPSRPATLDIEADADQLLNLIKDRLIQMPNVAKAKVYLGLPTEDTKREEALLQAIELDAKATGLEPKFTRDFFVAQFTAAKTYQDALRPKLARPDPSDEGMKAAEVQMTDARKQINECNEKLLKILGKLKWPQHEQAIRQRVTDRAAIVFSEIPENVWRQAIEPLR